MATITWKGEGPTGPSSVEWRGITFPLGKPVEVSDPWLIAKAMGNRFFDVDDVFDIEPNVAPPPEPEHDPNAPHHEPIDIEEDEPQQHKPRRRK